IWRMIGYYMMILLAGLQNISQELYESAEIDGANGWKKFVYITLPLLKPTMTFVSIVAVIFAFQAMIPAMLMTSGGPAGATYVLMLYMYDNAFKFFRMGRASAVSVLMMIVLLLLSFIQLKLSSRGEKA